MKKLLKYLKIVITIAVLGFFVYYFINNKEDLLKVLSVPILPLVGIMISYSIVFYLNGVFIKVILKTFKKKISLIESFYVSVISSLGNYFLPMRGGAVIRSVYLKKNFEFPYEYFVSTLYGYYIIVFLVNAFVGLISLVVISMKYGITSIPLYLFFGGLFVAMLVLSFVKFPVKKIKGSKNKVIDKVLSVIKNILEGWNMIVENKRLLISLIVITLVALVAGIALFYFEFRALSIDASIMNVILYNCLSGVSLLVSITPGSLGIREGIFSITSDILGISNEQIMQLALLDRGVSVIVLVVLFVPLYTIVSFKKRYEASK
ncbi:TPA: flippase-like domain-containing protein [Candidatus Dojkabacteria bacterium]|uniref:Flippase-like domain-containing protein n=1 Tax=Candidatus Dojkabacteria bacterium TaxID=2099670 RepID=A0A832R8V0_9BACT|nr:flippase-like domain-containing protein [Candidatus Dojkabacteria bacterium]